MIENDRLIGAVMYGDPSDSNRFFGLIKAGTYISEMRETLIFGPAYQGGRTAGPYGGHCSLTGWCRDLRLHRPDI